MMTLSLPPRLARLLMPLRAICPSTRDPRRMGKLSLGGGGNRTRVHINRINYLRPKPVPQRCLKDFRPTEETQPCPRRKSGLLGLTRIVPQEFFKSVERLLREPFERIVLSDDLKSVFVFS